jgi:hypothetical protein
MVESHLDLVPEKTSKSSTSAQGAVKMLERKQTCRYRGTSGSREAQLISGGQP